MVLMNQAYKVIFFSLDRRTSVFVLQFRCSCENCQIMGRAEACVCCQEIEAVKNKLVEAVTCGECEEQPTCITQHPGFHPVCINRWVLQTAWYQYKQQYKDPDMMALKINYIDTLPIGSWLDGTGEFWGKK